VVGDPTSLGFELSPENPLPTTINAVRWAVGKLVVGEQRYVKLSVRLLTAAPDSGIINNSEVFGGDSAEAAGKSGKDAPWRYLVPSVADSNSDLYVLTQVVAVNGAPFFGSVLPSGATVTYRTSYFNSGNPAQTNLVLATQVPSQMAAGSFTNLKHISGVDVIPDVPPAPSAGGTVTFDTIPLLGTAGGGVLEFDVVLVASTGTLTRTTTTFKSTELPKGVFSNAPVVIGSRAFLLMSKAVTPSTALPGEQVTYTITVTNSGFATATTLLLHDFLPTGDTSGSGASKRFQFVTGSSTFTGIAGVTPTVTTPATQFPYVGHNREEVAWAFGGGVLAPGATLTVSFKGTVGSAVTKLPQPYGNSGTMTYFNGSATTQAGATHTAGVLVGNSLAGTVFEDTGYVGGPGRSLAAAGGSAYPLAGARVELYDAAGAFVTSTPTAADGAYLFGGLAGGTFSVRVATSTLGDVDSPPKAGLLGASAATAVELFESTGAA
jgi:uncharacterized repeat protein (TIGR01451 family)